MRVRCAWCRRLLAEKGPKALDQTSHTICRRCLRLNLGLPEEAEGEDGQPAPPPPAPRQP